MAVRGGWSAWLGRRVGAALQWLLDRVARIAPRRAAPAPAAGALSAAGRRVARDGGRCARGGALRAHGGPDVAEVADVAELAELPELDGLLADAEADLLPWGDFADAREARRFAALPPIEPGAAEGVDWDALARDSTRGP